ncbi:MAG: aminotransferase class III-fold pyridoxal phosphate-dependent enzyme [Acidobacteria bacterium]|nr:aminotransferase class III-fold pyridoxal phosphate-dependent enzyme [Acidobacteriota bacterium]
MPTYSLEPRPTPRVDTALRRIVTALPVPESVPLLQRLYRAEPVAMQGQPPIVWDRAEGFQVYDAWGNCWIDWSSGVLITNAGHSHPRILEAIRAEVDRKLLTTYCFANEARLALVERLQTVMPAPLEKIFLLTTGSETVECAIKLCRTHGVKAGGPRKNVIVSYQNAFHGRTLGSQQAGGIPALKDWIVNLDPGFVQIPFPDGYRCEDVSFDVFERCLREAGVQPSQVAGVILETYQGGDAAFAPVEYMQALRRWCDQHQALLVCDEVQAGFGRTGKLWGFEHYGIVPDLTTWGKGISSSLPIAAVAGRADVMDLHAPGSMTSTHSGNPVCCAAALASLEAILSEDLVGNAERIGNRMHEGLQALAAEHDSIAAVMGKGLVAGVVMADPETGRPDGALAADIVWRALQKGVLMFSPVGFGGGTVKIAPPLCLTAEAADESMGAFEQAVQEAVAARAVAPATA